MRAIPGRRGRALGGCSTRETITAAVGQPSQNSVKGEFSLKDKDSGASHHLKVHAFLILERVAGSKEFLVSVLLQADGQFIGKTSLGIVAEGQEILLSLRWDKPRQRFVASSQAPGGEPILSFIPFALPGAADAPVSPEFSMARSIALKPGRRGG